MRRRYRALLVVVIALPLALAALDAATPAPPAFTAVRAAWTPATATLVDRRGEPLHELRVDFTARRGAWVPLAAVSPGLRDAVVRGEDRRFATHAGIDWLAAAAALRARVTGARARGASTLSMQLAALLDPRLQPRAGRRTLVQKFAQARAARALERAWRKDAILEAYLNLVTWRGELRGIGAASAALFGKHPDGLDAAEAAILAALLPAPTASATAVARRACRRLPAAPAPDCTALAARAEAAFARAHRPPAVPDLAPHLARRLLHAPGARVPTTLDARIQRLARDALASRLAGLARSNVRDGAALVVDNASGEVLAWVASAGPTTRAGHVDGVLARRQAGSTLKPFLYGLAIERRYLTAASVLEDTPINLETATGLYIPQNYDRDFKGPVSVRTALASSLNVPAVRALVLTGVEPFRERLQAFGYAGITRDGDYYGYSLALGSAEVSLAEQVAAYSALARGGRWSPLRVQSAPARPGRPVMGAGAAWIVGDILADRAARATTFGLDSALSTRYWSAVKTGTSKDMRDNWCIGWTDRYTVGVWVGNFEGDAMRDVSGVSGAAPAWLQIMNALHAGVPSHQPPPPADLERRTVAFVPPIEAPRVETWLAGTARPLVELVGGGAPRIAAPPNGVVIALDPDIPRAHQQVAIAVRGATAGLRLELDGRPLGSAAAPQRWQPVPGRHRLVLTDGAGRAVDRIAFTVRGLR